MGLDQWVQSPFLLKIFLEEKCVFLKKDGFRSLPVWRKHRSCIICMQIYTNERHA